MRKCALHNLGCKVNYYETQAMQQLMEEAGYEIVPFGEEAADIYIINTCSVTNIADRKSRQMIHKARKMNDEAIIVATGCYVEAKKDLADDDIDIIIGNNEKSRLIEILDTYYSDDPMEEVAPINTATSFDEMTVSRFVDRNRAFVKIQDGCNRFCSYCIIPYVRGRIRSRGIDDIVEEVKRLVDAGCIEVVLTGIHVSSYGMDIPESGVGLIDVIEAVNGIEGIKRIRLSSFEPRIVQEDFVKRLAACEKICPHFHLSLQSGCDATLERMNRKYTSEEYYQSVLLLRRYFDNPAITTDVIVGFPGETEEEFNTTKAFLEKVKFYELHVFKYSRRKGTVADRMPNQLTEKVKSLRSDILLDMDRELSTEYREKYFGKEVTILTEEVVELDGEKYIVGFTDTYVKVAIKLEDDNRYESNMIIKTKISDTIKKDMVIGVAEN